MLQRKFFLGGENHQADDIHPFFLGEPEFLILPLEPILVQYILQLAGDIHLPVGKPRNLGVIMFTKELVDLPQTIAELLT